MNNLPVQNLKNKETRFNSKGFDDFKDILNCGYSEIKATIEGKLVNFKTCFYIPSQKMPKELELYYINFLAKSILPDYLGFALYYIIVILMIEYT